VRVLFAVALLAACSKKSDPPGPPPPPPGPAVDICDLGTRALDHVTCSSGSGAAVGQARKTFVGFVDAIRKASQADAHQFQIMCAQMLTALEKDTVKNGCTMEMSPADRASLKAVLEGYYAERTKIAPTGDAASDAVIAHIGEIRESMCACSTMMCLEMIDKQLETIGSLPATAPQPAHDLGNKLIDDIGRCEARIRTAAGL
jgi:hypothetical protein